MDEDGDPTAIVVDDPMKLYAEEPYYLNKINKNAVYTNSV